MVAVLLTVHSSRERRSIVLLQQAGKASETAVHRAKIQDLVMAIYSRNKTIFLQNYFS